jgi:hypothetical protein
MAFNWSSVAVLRSIRVNGIDSNVPAIDDDDVDDDNNGVVRRAYDAFDIDGAPSTLLTNESDTISMIHSWSSIVVMHAWMMRQSNLVMTMSQRVLRLSYHDAVVVAAVMM